MFGKINHFHFIGIGGIGMSGLAKTLLEWGYQVSGSDMSSSAIINDLVGAGAVIHTGHSAENIPADTQAVIYTSAVKTSNPEYAEAVKRQLPCIKRAKLLGQIAKHWTYTVCIAGTHGKTTTSAMVANIFQEAGAEPGFFLGGIVHPFMTNARTGSQQWIIIEADEYDRSFLQLQPHFNIVTNIELDHTDIYHSYEDLNATFLQYINSIPFYGMNILNEDNPGIHQIKSRITSPYLTFGESDSADYRITHTQYQPSGTQAVIFTPDGNEISLHISQSGKHNLLNATAAFALAHTAGIDSSAAIRALAKFETVDRRFQIRGEVNGVTFIDDYAHHPTELKATLDAARQRFPGHRIIAVFQPHTYTRTRDFFTEFARTLGLADEIFVLDVYAARENAIENISGKLISDAASHYHHKHAHFIQEKEFLAHKLAAFLAPGDVILFIGAGDVNNFINDTMEKYEKR